MKTLIKILLVIFPAGALAAPFAEVGLGYAVDGCLADGWTQTNGVVTIGCSDSPLGIVALGYRFGDSGFTIQADHWSSILEQDKGISAISIRYRWEGK